MSAMLVGEQRSGNLLVQLDGKLQAQPVELLRQRWGPEGHGEYLIRWAVQNTEEAAGSSGSASQAEGKSSNILMWMSAEEVYANCPTLLGKRKPEGPGMAEEKAPGSPDEGALQEMTEDVRTLVQRAARQMAQSSGPDSSILNTIHVLSAYASIGALAGVFKETGALDLLMKMLCNPEKQIRKNAGKMLRALASHDAGSRAHVLLSLSQQDGIEQHMDFESRYTLLQLFAETTSSEEHCISFDGIHLPQIPGKQLFSLVKRYLCVTSLLDQLSSDRPDRSEKPRLQRQFDFSMAMGSLICELVRAMGWVVEPCPAGGVKKGSRSVLSRKFCSLRVTGKTQGFLVRSDFPQRRGYAQYLRATLLPGMAVRISADHWLLRSGDKGVFLHNVKGTPTVLIYWQRLGLTHPVDWDMLDIISCRLDTEERVGHVPAQMTGAGPSLRKNAGDASRTDCQLLSREDWWEILLFVRRLDCEGQRQVVDIIRGNMEPELPLFQMSVSAGVAQQVVASVVQSDSVRSLLRMSRVYSKLYGPHNAPCEGPSSPTRGPGISSSHREPLEGSGAAGPSDLKTLKSLLMMEGLRLSDPAEEKNDGRSLDPEVGIKGALESCCALVREARHAGLERKLKSLDVDWAQGASASDSNLREKTVKLLVELLTSQMKEKILVVTCLQLTYLVMSTYDWRVRFAAEGGVWAVLASMQEHESSAAVQHVGLAVLKVLMGAGCCRLWGISQNYTLRPEDAQAIKEVFSDIKSMADGTSTSLLAAIPGAIIRMMSVEGCLSSVYNGLLVVRMLTQNHRDLLEPLCEPEVTAVLQSLLKNAQDLLSEPQQHLLSFLLPNMLCRLNAGAGSSPVLVLEERDLMTLLNGLKDSQKFRKILPSLERCIYEDCSSLCCDVPQVLADRRFYSQLFCSLELLRSEKCLRLCVYRMLNKALHLYEEDSLPWHQSIAVSLGILEAASGVSELLQEVVCFLHSLSSLSKDHSVLMCCLQCGELLKKLPDQQTSESLTSDLKDRLASYERFTNLHNKMSAGFLAGCMQIVLCQIDEERLRPQGMALPLLDVFLQSLAGACIRAEHKQGRCWEKLETSSNPQKANRLTDGNLKSYWQSSSSSRCHYINIYMCGGVVIRKLVLIVASEDGGYMPAQVVVKGGEKPFKMNTLLSEVNIGSTAGRVALLENVARFWPVIQIQILRCQQGGIDTRVRGLEILGKKPTLWTVFEEQLCRRTFLFYTSKAHTWGQEIHRKKENLLQLFRRLNRALSHEQEFAERFLPDDEAAQALGRTCWEALICPLVQSITTPDPGAESPLGWLLMRYLENSRISRRPQSRLSVFNSRVRRLTHLLVHVDTSPPDTTVLKPPTKTNGKRRDSSIAPVTVPSAGLSSMAGMAQCWQGVVQQQVQRFLERSWNDADLVPRLCAAYLNLRRAMEEMFGQQTLFLLALRQGFCEGLLQLSFLTALHVMEQFARYIDQRVTAVRFDASDVQSLEQLQQFLEFVLFLSDLELANSFEHFYRHYLADRLLTLGPCWLENSVVNHIGVCFPNRFPQQMLKNLQEAKDLQREEHLYRLQELDTGLLSEEEGEETEESAEPHDCDAEEAEVQISVLSPRCWSVSSPCYMMAPSRHFPQSLSSPLQHFADFYLKSQSALGGSKLKQLQWTWLGNAEIQYGDLTLRVSTLQMFILLHFNQQEELLEETVTHSSGLPEALVHHALTPLIARGGILLQKKGLLCLNEEGLIDRGTGKVLQLLPRQTYLNVEEDEGRTLEKKRNIILCLITQIMKEEKEIHIDNLVFRVIESCRKLEAGKTPKFLNFSCNDTDVLSCIMYLIGQGYARRGEDSPHIIEYLSKDPSTPHKGKAHISFQSSAGKNQDGTNKCLSSGGAVEQAVLESVLLPMGRTLRQEEVGKLMSHMVDQVSETLSVNKDQAEHLLIYCKWNMDLLLQKYTDDPEILLVASGLHVQESQASESPQATCPVCMGPLSPADNPPCLCCRHSCCQNCWKEYLTTRIEQNLVLNCTCPTTDCVAQPTSEFIRKIISSKEVIEKYEKALLRGFVESCSNLTWCTNPQGCDRILCKEGLGTGAACAKCSWLSCFNCSFPEAHYPASCSHMSQWMDDGGFYEGMTAEAQSKHLTKLISKHCPSCQAPIEKNEGCLHMTCAKCNHGFCWRCLKPWKPTHKDYYNCTAMVSKAARQEKRFQDYNERCTFQHQAKDFAVSLRSRLSVLNEEVPLRTLSFLIAACKVLEMSRKVLGYACVYSYYNQDSERLDVLESQTENLEFQVNALQLLLEYGLLQSEDLACSVRLLSSDQYNSSLELVRRVQERLNGILQHSTQDFRVGFLPAPEDAPGKAPNLSEMAAFSGAADTIDAGSDTGDTADDQEDDDDDDEYVPEWNVDYDDDLDEDDFSYDEDDESENLEPDSFIFEDYDGEAY